eukprot:scaffold25722_cov109-Isochrysis_galbana.AAC.7
MREVRVPRARDSFGHRRLIAGGWGGRIVSATPSVNRLIGLTASHLHHGVQLRLLHPVDAEAGTEVVSSRLAGALVELSDLLCDGRGELLDKVAPEAVLVGKGGGLGQRDGAGVQAHRGWPGAGTANAGWRFGVEVRRSHLKVCCEGHPVR